MQKEGTSLYYAANYTSPIGQITMAGDDKNLVGLWLEGQKYFGGTLSGKFVYQMRDDSHLYR